MGTPPGGVSGVMMKISTAGLAIYRVLGIHLPTLRHNPLTHELLPFEHRPDRFEKLLSSIDLCDVSMAAHVQSVFHHLQRIVLAQEDEP